MQSWTLSRSTDGGQTYTAIWPPPAVFPASVASTDLIMATYSPAGATGQVVLELWLS